jgi:hypothetical protein
VRITWPVAPTLAVRCIASWPSKAFRAFRAVLRSFGFKWRSILKPAKPPIDSLHRLLCLFGDGVGGRSTLSDMEPVTTFSGE